MILCVSGAKDPDSVFRSYPKISASGRLSGPVVREWIAVEKVHGAHFAVVCDEVGVRPGKRRELLGEDGLDTFFGVSRIWPAMSVAAGRFAEALRSDWGTAATITMYGELAGGCYPHSDISAVAGVQPVQTGVWYAPGLEWLLFDASVDDAEGHCWVSDHALRGAAAVAGLTCVPALARGALNKVQDLPSAFPTKVPGLLGLPELPENLAEGYVLKPAGVWREAGDNAAGERPIAKVKQKGFAEDERFDGSRPYLAPPQGAAGIPAWLLVQATALLTPARAAAAVSKLGPAASVDALVNEITQDISQELAEALGGVEDALLSDIEQALTPGARALAVFDAEDRRTRRSEQGLRKRESDVKDQ